jgi:hypothetical protein
MIRRLFHPECRVDKIPDPDLHQRIQVFLTQAQIRSRMFIPDPGSGFFSVTDFKSGFQIQGSIKHRIPD